MRWLGLYLRSRGAPVAFAVTLFATVVSWAGWMHFSDARTVDPKGIAMTVMLGVAAFARTLSGPDDSLESTAAVRWPARRFAHVVLVGAVIVGLLLPSLLTDARFEPVAVVLRNTAGLLGLTALGAAVGGAALSWVAPLVWTIVSVLPFLQPSGRVGPQVVGWLIQPTGTTAATVCAAVLAVAGLAAYTWRGSGLSSSPAGMEQS